MNMTTTPELVSVPDTHYLFLQKIGPFQECAPKAWQEMFPLAKGHIEQDKIVGCMALCAIERDKSGHETMIYQAGYALNSEPRTVPTGLQYKKTRGGKYARFLLTGPYDQLGEAWQEAFRIINEAKMVIRRDFCIENYLNDASKLPPEQWKTELLIPVS